MPNFVLQGYILVPESDLAAVKAELPNHIALTCNEKGCIVFSVNQCVKEPLRFNVYEEFVDQLAFDLHQKRVKASLWAEVTVRVERHYEILIK
ncbi:putative quinol monooxygenase [Marinomonas atlantica]|uniref:putative quinol monooxygenase n=1 Tax=Marinomonas atlantica TaxID=1806668 RepID=UPI000831C815|nr:antibiotic biosynthesis monooxygenase [Marinomonas atlantica]MCO4786530.1 antibiotic biosynthesis monooxygenase [Marinomonas atlantica]